MSAIPVDEGKAFSPEIIKWALGFCLRVLAQLNEHFPRPADKDQYARTVSIPKA